MRNRIIFALILLAAVLGGISFFHPRPVNGDDEENLPIYESVPDRMVIYQGDMALIRDKMKIYSGREVQIILPDQAIPETVQILDGGERINQFNFAHQAPQGKRYSNAASGVKNLLSWKSKNAGSRQIQLDYMMRGISWTPSFIMHIDSDKQVRLSYRMGIRNNTDTETEVDLILVSGLIGSPRTGSGNYYRAMNQAQAVLNTYEGNNSSEKSGIAFLGATKINRYYIYTIPKTTLRKNGVSFVTVFDGKLEAARDFVWATSTGEMVDIIYTVKNSAKIPFAEGLVNVYRDNVFMGSDIIEWTPAGGKGHITVGGAVDIQAVKTIDIDEIPERKGRKEYLHRVEMTITNFSDKARTVKVIESKYPDAVEKEYDLQPDKTEANTHMWNLNIPPNSKKIIKYRFHSDSRYNNPYQKY